MTFSSESVGDEQTAGGMDPKSFTFEKKNVLDLNIDRKRKRGFLVALTDNCISHWKLVDSVFGKRTW